MSLEDFKKKVKNGLAILGVAFFVMLLFGKVISILFVIGMAYLYFSQMDMYIRIKNGYNRFIEALHKSFGQNLDLEKYRK